MLKLIKTGFIVLAIVLLASCSRDPKHPGYIYITDYARSGEELKNPLEATKENIAEGQKFYEIYCAICHGKDLDGNGRIVSLEKFPPPPSFFNDYMRNLPDGKKFFSIHYGKGLMGSYASQLTQEERWKVILYIDKMQEEKK